MGEENVDHASELVAGNRKIRWVVARADLLAGFDSLIKLRFVAAAVEGSGRVGPFDGTAVSLKWRPREVKPICECPKNASANGAIALPKPG
jgi:hypothetical protein